jgi:hypothetical protein
MPMLVREDGHFFDTSILVCRASASRYRRTTKDTPVEAGKSAASTRRHYAKNIELMCDVSRSTMPYSLSVPLSAARHVCTLSTSYL